MTLQEAVEEVISQNRKAKYTPTRFIEMTKNGEAENLKEVISGLVLNPEVKEKIFITMEKYKGKPIFIEEFISMYYFDLSKEVVKEAMQRTKEIQQSRLFYNLN
ncbi:MAG: hypothetical protein WC650_04180 [Candidatus Doudnabacteria bacterium]